MTTRKTHSPSDRAAASMKRQRTRISARARKHFLQLAAVAFAVGGNGVAAAAEAASAERRAPAVDAPTGDARYRHEFALARDDAGQPLAATIAVIPLAFADAFTVDAAGPCCIGPLRAGPYALRITQGRQVDQHLVRIDRATGAFLHFAG